MKSDRTIEQLKRAIEDWSRRGNAQPLSRWLARELDAQGTPSRLPISGWLTCLEYLLAVDADDREWPTEWHSAITRLLRTILWFTRSAGLPVTDFDLAESRRPLDQMIASDASTSTRAEGRRAIKQWLTTIKRDRRLDERPPWGASNRVIDVLRPDRREGGDFVAIDHRDPRSPCRFELFAGGRSWLGPVWDAGGDDSVPSIPKPRSWASDSSNVLAEWSYRDGGAQVTRSAMILGGHSLAILSLSALHRAPPPAVASIRLALAPGILAAALEGSRGMLLKPSTNRGSAQVLPIALPSLAYSTDRGSFVAVDGVLDLKQAPAGRHSWLPLLVSWDAKRHRKDVRWRILSVSEGSRNVPPDRAFAVRVSWGRHETYVIYRSFAKPAPRAFLGHQTAARVLVGVFNADGIVEPIFKVD
jgi:hypothetical protein